MVSPNSHALNGWDCMNQPQVTQDLGLRTMCEAALLTTISGRLEKNPWSLISINLIIIYQTP